MSNFEDRETLAQVVSTGKSTDGRTLEPNELRAAQRLLDLPTFDEMTVEQRRAAYNNLSRGFQPDARTGGEGDTVTVLGWLLTGAGVIAAIGSFFLKTSIESTTPSSMIGDSYIPASTSDVINIGLLQTQMMVFQAGLALAIAGVVLLGAALVRNVVVKAANPAAGA
jgi:hypothetical protein